MLKRSAIWLACLALTTAGGATAQIGLPLPGGGGGGGVGGSAGDGAGGVLGTVAGGVGAALGDGVGAARDLANDVSRLAADRLTRLGNFVRDHRDSVEMDDQDQPARRGEVLVLDPDAAALAAAAAAGFGVIEQGTLDGLGVAYARLRVPSGQPLAPAERHLRKLLPGKTITADTLHFPSGADAGRPGAGRSPVTRTGGMVGVIDGGMPPGPRVMAQAGFAADAPRPNAHAAEIGSLLAGAGVARILSADVFGADPAGGNALAIARALGWMAEHRAPVVSISLVGPPNPLLARAIAAVQGRGMLVVAAVGNDGMAAPAAYPASYPGVVAVTGVDGRGRVLFEAGRSLHLDYAAPGADMSARDVAGRLVPVRGTSFAAPLAAARLAAWRAAGADRAGALAHVDAEAVDRRPGTGRGIVCGACRVGL